MSLTKVTYSMIDGNIANVKDYGAVGNGSGNDAPAIQDALNASKNVYIPPTANYYRITTPLTIPSGCNLFMNGVTIVSTVAGIFRFSSGGVAAIHAARAVMQTDTNTAGAAVSIASGASSVTEAYIYGFPLIIQTNSIVNDASRGVDMSGFYRSYLEVKSYNFYHGIYADGDGGGTLATYYNVLMKPDVRCGNQGYAIRLTNLANATTIVSPFINGAGVGYGGISIEDTGACNVLGGYLESFAANASTFGIRLNNSDGTTVTGVALDQNAGDVTANYAIRLLGTSTGCSIINPQFAGSWNDSTRLLLNTASGKNTFIGNGYTNAFVLGQAGTSIANEGVFAGQINSTTASGSVTYPSFTAFRANEGLLMSTTVDGGSGASTYPSIFFGTGSPNGVYTARAGSIFMRRDGGANTCFYVKESDVGNTGWVAK